jgi:2-polyprenyl-3-methyl-5-hydroxy-6-metoxy-1,4-benzoquinol methylase
MPVNAENFSVESVRAEWNAAAAAFADAQATGRDIYRLEVFGPAQAELCGPVRGLRVLDLGCGAGYFAREMAKRGASVTGLELSPEMLRYAIAKEERDRLGIRYLLGDAACVLEQVEPDSFDLVTSCLALQDMPDVPAVLRAAREALVRGGRIVVSIAHPCTDTPFRRWEKEANGAKQWLCVDRYFERGPMTYRWQGWSYEFSTTALHATLEDWLAWFLAAGFSLRGLREPVPSPEAVARHPELEDCSRVPYFLLLDFERR